MMSCQLPCLLILLCYTGYVNSQTVSGITSQGQTYLCLPSGTTCPTNGGGGGTNTNTIDPRIVTPTGQTSVCPAGTFPCFGQPTNCGARLGPVNNSADGPSDFGAYPWQAYLRNTTNAFAGSGVLIDSMHVLTAAHKVYRNVGNPTAVTVLMGVWNPANLANIESSTVAAITVHPNFEPRTLMNDIAILTLTQPIVLGIYLNINTICLPPAGTTSFVGQNCQVSGWGQTAFTSADAPTNPQKQVRVNIVNYATCRASMGNPNVLGNNVDTYLDQNGEICAGGEANKDACTQDGGSPLVCPTGSNTYTLAGLVIWGKNCGQPGVYGVYVNVPLYLSWIQGVISAAG